MKITPANMKFLLNIYGPYLGAGVRVTRISSDWREMDLSMKLRWFNKNYFGTHFGGSLYSMTDPHYMLLLIQLLGKDYIVWDKSAAIEYVKPGKGAVRAHLRVTDEALEKIRAEAATGEPTFAEFDIEILDESNMVVARVHKTIYVKLKKVHQD